MKNAKEVKKQCPGGENKLRTDKAINKKLRRKTQDVKLSLKPRIKGKKF